MTNLISLPDRSPTITSEEWRTFVTLSNDIRLAEKVLSRMKAEYKRRERDILEKLRQGASIEHGGRVAGLG